MNAVFGVKLGLTGLTPTDLVEKGRNLSENCTGNANLSLPAGFLTDFDAAIDALAAANLAVLDNGGRQDVLIRNARAADLSMQIRKLGGYVEAQCSESEEKVASTGFAVRRRPSPVGVPDAPGNLRARRGKLSGEADLRWDAVYGRQYYSVWINSGDPNDASGWSELARTGKNYHTVEGLASDKPYYFRVQAVGAAGVGPQSDSATTKAA